MRRPLLAATLLCSISACAPQPAESKKDEDKGETKDASKPDEAPPAAESGDAADPTASEPALEPERGKPSFTRDNIVSEEAYDRLETGLSEAEVIAAFGEPEKKDEEVLQEATGEYIMTLDYPKQGLSIDLTRAEGTETDARTVGGYLIQAPSELKSRLGVGIGSSRADVEKHYGALKDEDGFTNDEKFVAGSVYGGEIFNFKDGKVSSIFVGAAAE